MLGLLKEEALDLNRDGGWDDPRITLNKVHHPTVLEKWKGGGSLGNGIMVDPIS